MRPDQIVRRQALTDHELREGYAYIASERIVRTDDERYVYNVKIRGIRGAIPGVRSKIGKLSGALALATTRVVCQRRQGRWEIVGQ